MVAGIIVTAAADEKVLSDPSGLATTATAWMILGGPALFMAGHVAFKFVVWRYVSWPRVGGIVVLALLGLAARSIPALALAACAAGLVTAVAVTDRLPWLPRPVLDSEGPAADPPPTAPSSPPPTAPSSPPPAPPPTPTRGP
ncbi:MAG: low temperature requirement protein A [Streptosporangiaceae bacterium]